MVTDKPDYLPGEDAVLTGAGFAPLEAIDLSIALQDPVTGVVVPDWEWAQGYADDQGGFIAYYLVPEIAAGKNLIATATGLASGLTASVLFTDAPPVRKYSAAISGVTPSPAVAGSPATFTLTVTNSTDSTVNLGSANVSVPGWTDVSLGTVTNPPAKGWSATLVSGVIELRPQAPQGLKTLAPGEAVSVVVTGTAPSADSYVWTTAAKQSTDFSGTASFNLVGSQPSIDVVPAAVATTLVLNSVSPDVMAWGSGGSAALTATLTRNDTDAGVVGATVEFCVDGSSVGTAVTVAGGVASLSYGPSALVPGSHTVQASFAEQVIDAITFLASASDTLALEITAPTTLVLNSVSPDSVTVGSGGPVGFAATLTRDDTDEGVDGATVDFLVDGDAVGNAVTAGGGVVIFDYDPSALAPGSHTVQASFAGQVIGGITFLASASDTWALDVTVQTTLVLDSVTPDSVTVGSSGPIALTATLTRDDTDEGLDGATVGFSVDGNPVGSAATAGGGVVIFDYDPSALAPGSHTVQASFAGQVIGGITFEASTSGTQTLDVTVPTTLVLNGVSPDSVTVGSAGPVAFAATLTRNDTEAGVEGATIEFTVDGNSAGTADTGTGGSATLNYDPSALAPGSHTVQASFDGQNIGGITFESSVSGTQTLDVTVPTTLILNSVSPDSVPVGSSGPVALTATLTRNDTEAGVEGATIEFTVDGGSAGTADTGAGGAANLNYDPSALAPGSHTVQASFDGQNIGGITFESSASGTQTLNVTVPTTLNLDVSPSEVILHGVGPVAFTATLTRDDTDGGVVGATIDFTVDGNSVGTAATGTGGVASLNYDPSALAAGSHTIQGSFAGQVLGGVTFLASTSDAQTLRIAYNFIGFLPPVDNLPLWNVAKAGRTVPVKWRLTDANGAFISSLATVMYNPLRYRRIGDDSAPGDLMETTTTGATVLRYDSTANQFIYNWQTSSAFANQCYELLLELDDGTVHIAKFKFTR